LLRLVAGAVEFERGIQGIDRAELGSPVSDILEMVIHDGERGEPVVARQARQDTGQTFRAAERMPVVTLQLLFSKQLFEHGVHLAIKVLRMSIVGT